MTRRNLRNNFKSRTLSYSLAALSLFLGIFFLFQYDSYVSADYERGEKEREVKELAGINEELGESFLETSRLKDIETIAQDHNFEKTTKIYYIRIPTAGVAAVK